MSDALLSTKSATFHNNGIMVQATLQSTDENSRPFYVFCSIPGGRPWATFDPRSQQKIPITNAPECETFKEFKAFVIERFEVPTKR